MNDETFHLVAAIAMVVATLALVAIAVVVALLARDARQLLRRLDDEVPATLRQARATAASVERLTDEARPRLERLDRLADASEETLGEVRDAAAAANAVVRGPADVVEGARRTAEQVGIGLVSGVLRLGRRMTGDEPRGDEPRGDDPRGGVPRRDGPLHREPPGT